MRRPSGHRPAKTLVLFVLLLPALMAWCGLTIDAGLLMAGHRQTQNAADAAALAAANVLAVGGSNSTALTTANAYVQQYNGLAAAPSLVSGTSFNVPPLSGPYAGNSSFVEVIVQYPVQTYFVGAAGYHQTPQVSARAVAGFKSVSLDFGAAILDTTAIPGLSLSGQAQLIVNGKVVVNSHGAGYDQNGGYVNLGYSPYAVSTSGRTTVQASDLEVVGGVSSPSSIVNLPGNPGSPLHAGVQPLQDPLLNLATPTTSNGVVATYWGLNGSGVPSVYGVAQDVAVAGQQSVTLKPGIYRSITLTAGAKVTLNPGVYVLTGGGLSVSGQASLTGTGVMIYNTGSDYNPATGYPDSADGNTTPAAPATTLFGGVTLTGGGSINLTAISDASSPYDGLLYFQRRWNPSQFTITGQGGLSNLNGTLYGKWANFSLSGQGNYNAQFVVGSMSLSGQANVTINNAGQKTAKAGNVYLVE